MSAKYYTSFKEYHKNVLVVGEEYCGKTSLLIRFLEGRFMEEDGSTMPKEFSVDDMNVNEKFVVLNIRDTDGSIYSSFDPQKYLNLDVILMCFCVDVTSTLSRVKFKWSRKMKKFYPGVPIVLVGNKLDLRETRHKKLVTTPKDGQGVADEIGAYRFLECSAKLDNGVPEVFQAVAEAALSKEKEVKTKYYDLM